MKDFKGTIVSFNETKYTSAIAMYDPILKAVNQIAKAYEELDTTFKFNTEVYNSVITEGVDAIRRQYKDRLEQQIKASKFTSSAIFQNVKDRAEPELSQITEKIALLKTLTGQALVSMQNIHIDLNTIRIEDGKAVLNEDSKRQIKETLTIRVVTEEQNVLYNHLSNLKQTYEALTGFMKESGIDMDNWGDIISDKGNGLCWEDKGKLIIDPNSLTIKLKT